MNLIGKGAGTYLRKYLPVLALVVLCLMFSILQPMFPTFSNAMIVLQQTVVLLCAAFGMTFVIVGGSIDLSVGSILAVAALATAIASKSMGVFAFVPALLVGALCGAVNGLIFVKGKVPSFIVTLGTMTTLRGVVLFFTKGAPVEISDDAFLDVFAGRLFGVPTAAFIALAAGISDGLGFGDNTKAALMTRGIAEVARLGVALGANRDTFYGLAGMGDMIVTCCSMHSRNRRAGILLGQGMPLQQALDTVHQVVEGVVNAQAAMELADKYGIEMPITREMNRVLFEGADPRVAVITLMGRDKKGE